VGQSFDVSVIDSYSDFSTWAGTRQGLYVSGNSSAWFDLYIYRDAFTPILAECPANQFGTTRTLTSSGDYVLDNIQNNDWALYAGVEFGNGDYYNVPDSIQFSAACGSSGGTIEVWLDSIGTGTKIADCVFENTGGWSTYKNFKAPVPAVSGNHDVYLRFTGEGSSKLFLLKWLSFDHQVEIVDASPQLKRAGKFSVYPNPAKDYVTIRSGFSFRKIEIFNTNGKRVLYCQQQESEKSNLDIDLTAGLYLLKISSKNKFACSKLMIR